jgi:chromosome segregation ATPase
MISAIEKLPALMPSNSQPRTGVMPLSLRVSQCISGASALGAVAALVYGIVANAMVYIAMGAVFLAASLVNFYLIYKTVHLTTIEEQTKKIEAINASLQAKDAQIQQLTNQTRTLADKLAALNKDYSRIMKSENEAQKALGGQIQQSADKLAKAEADAKKQLELTAQSMAREIEAFKRQSANDQKVIAQLNQSIDQLKAQNSTLQSSIADLRKQIDTYQQQISRYSQLNSELENRVKALQKAVQSPGCDLSMIQAHTVNLEDAIAKQKAVAEKTAKTTAEINAMLDAINRRLANQKPSQSAGK